MTIPRTPGERAGRWGFLAFCAAVFAFLVAPILVIVPLSFNAEPYFTFTEGMLRLDPEAYSLRWYRDIFADEKWMRALANSLIIGVSATLLATALGTLAALGLANSGMPGRRLAMGLLISPMVTPVIISAAGMFFFYSNLGLAQTHWGLILAHAALGTPFVVITVTATLSGFDPNLMRAAASLGAGPLRSFQRVQFPLIAPGIFSGALFAFATSFDEVVVVLFLGGLEQRTIPRQMWAGIREQISPTILAVATFLIVFALLLLFTVAWLRRRATENPASAEPIAEGPFEKSTATQGRPVRMSTKRLHAYSGAPWESQVGYSRALRVGDSAWVSGTTAIDPDGNVVGPGSVYDQTMFIFGIIAESLAEFGLSLSDVVRTRTFITDPEQFDAFGRAHKEALGPVSPAATCVVVSRLVRPELLVEIEAEAVFGAEKGAP